MQVVAILPSLALVFGFVIILPRIFNETINYKSFSRPLNEIICKRERFQSKRGGSSVHFPSFFKCTKKMFLFDWGKKGFRPDIYKHFSQFSQKKTNTGLTVGWRGFFVAFPKKVFFLIRIYQPDTICSYYSLVRKQLKSTFPVQLFCRKFLETKYDQRSINEWFMWFK